MPIQGTVTAKKCDCCEHHEIGIETDTGEYVPLKPGMKVEIKDLAEVEVKKVVLGFFIER